MKTSKERADKIMAALRPVYLIASCMIENEHHGDDELALHALEAIKGLALALYPFHPDDSDVNSTRAIALAMIAETAMAGIEGKPIRGVEP